jgi:hypothetical protein
MSAPLTSPRVRALSSALREARLAAERDRILELARNASEPNWLTAGMPGMSPGLAGVLDCEGTASGITEWSHACVPGLLQISPYTRAILSASGTPPHQVEQLVMMRMGRRDILTRPSPIVFTALIAEAAVREVIGSREVQLEQLRHLLLVAERTNVTVQVVPPARGWHPGLAGPFVIYDFPHTPSIIHIEHYRSSAFLYEEPDVEAYQDAARIVRGLALGPADSAALIAGVITELERE